MAKVLSPTMTLREFENGYWYVDELKDFGDRIGIPGARKLRKDELERAIVEFLRTGKAKSPTKRALRKTGVKDLERGLSLNLPIVHYTSNRETKDFIVKHAKRFAPEVREKSGVWYRLNRWREEQITKGQQPTYGDLIQHYIRLNKMERFEKVPQVRYINFLAEFLATQKNATHTCGRDRCMVQSQKNGRTEDLCFVGQSTNWSQEDAELSKSLYSRSIDK